MTDFCNEADTTTAGVLRAAQLLRNRDVCISVWPPSDPPKKLKGVILDVPCFSLYQRFVGVIDFLIIYLLFEYISGEREGESLQLSDLKVAVGFERVFIPRGLFHAGISRAQTGNFTSTPSRRRRTSRKKRKEEWRNRRLNPEPNDIRFFRTLS